MSYSSMESDFAVKLVSSSRRQYVYKGRKEIRCRGCNEIVPLAISWSDPNPGRRYYGCRNFREGCPESYFEWVDDPFSEWISHLLRDFRDSERKLAKENAQLRRNMAVSHCIECESNKNWRSDNGSSSVQSVFKGKGGTELDNNGDEQTGLLSRKVKKWKVKFAAAKKEKELYRILFFAAMVYIVAGFFVGKIGSTYKMLS